ncbi:HEPN domain-containing protein [Pirellulaceae bacterium]|nr:HEPN domain-containing protein [Pirellulaceae bacterium]
MSSTSTKTETVRDLRRLWKPTKERLQRASSEHPLAVRMHRAFSWMSAVERDDDSSKADEKLVFRWIALNALYGRWNTCSNEPEADGQSLQRFMAAIEKLDQAQLINQCLTEHETLVVSICSDQFLNSVFWRLLDTDKRFNPNRDKYSIERLFNEKKWSLILDELIQRIYLVRCQLVHGASTYESRLNRETVGNCGAMLNHLLFKIIRVITDHGISENWDNLCYPPVNTAPDPTTSHRPKPR